MTTQARALSLAALTLSLRADVAHENEKTLQAYIRSAEDVAWLLREIWGTRALLQMAGAGEARFRASTSPAPERQETPPDSD